VQQQGWAGCTALPVPLLLYIGEYVL